MCSDAAIHTSHVTSSSPKTFANPSPAPGQPPEDERRQRRGQQAHHLDQHKEPERSEHRGREGTLVGHVALRDDRVPPPAHRGLRARRPRAHRVLGLRAQEHDHRAAGRRRGGPRRGRDLRARGPRRPAAGRPGARAGRRVDVRLVLRAPRRRSTSSPASRPQQDVYRRYRRWGFESAALDLALRQADTSLHELLGRTPEPVTFVVSSRMGEPPTIAPGHAPPGRLPGAALQARRHARTGPRS